MFRHRRSALRNLCAYSKQFFLLQSVRHVISYRRFPRGSIFLFGIFRRQDAKKRAASLRRIYHHSAALRAVFSGQDDYRNADGTLFVHAFDLVHIIKKRNALGSRRGTRLRYCIRFYLYSAFGVQRDNLLPYFYIQAGRGACRRLRIGGYLVLLRGRCCRSCVRASAYAARYSRLYDRG